MKNQHKKLLAVIAFGIFILFMVLVGHFIGAPMIQLAKTPSQFRSAVDSYGIWGRLLFVGMVVLQIVVAFIPGEPIELAAGFAFGFWEGTLLTLVGFLIGSAIVYLLVRKFGVMLVEVFFSVEKINHFSFLKNPQKAKTLAFILMLIPGTPKDFLSYFAGLTNISLKAWLFIVGVGRLPSLITSTATGAAAGKEDYHLSMIMIGVTCLLTIAGLVYYRVLCRTQREHEKE